MSWNAGISKPRIKYSGPRMPKSFLAIPGVMPMDSKLGRTLACSSPAACTAPSYSGEVAITAVWPRSRKAWPTAMNGFTSP